LVGRRAARYGGSCYAGVGLALDDAVTFYSRGMKEREEDLNFLQQEAFIDAHLDHDLRKYRADGSPNLINIGQETRCLAQIVRLLRSGMQMVKPSEEA
jgi:hypothetical protein